MRQRALIPLSFFIVTAILGARLTFLHDEGIFTLDFAAAVNDGKPTCRAGEALDVRPALYTGDGLLIERAYRGPFQSSPFDSGAGGRIVLRGADGAVLDSGVCGFA